VSEQQAKPVLLLGTCPLALRHSSVKLYVFGKKSSIPVGEVGMTVQDDVNSARIGVKGGSNRRIQLLS
jgi:hypothetical protein